VAEEVPRSLTGAFKRAGRDAVIYGIGQGLSGAAAFLLVPLYTRYFTQSDFGKLGLLLAVQEFLFALFGLGLVGALLRSYYDYDENDLPGKRNTINTGLILLIGGAFVFLPACWLVFPYLSKTLFQETSGTLLLWLVGIKALALAFQGVPLALFRARSQSLKFVLLTCILVVIKLGLIIYLVVGAGGGLVAALAGDAGTAVLGMGIMLWTIRKDLAWKFSWDEAKKMLAFGLPLVPADMASMVFLRADLFFLNRYTRLATVGQYNAAVILVHAMRMFILRPFMLVWAPIVVSVAKKDFAKEFYSRIMIYLLALVGTVGLVLSLFAPEVIRIMAGPGYESAAEVLPLLCLAQILYITQASVSIGPVLQRKTLYITGILFLVAVTTLITCPLLISSYGLMGAGLAGLVNSAVFFLLTYAASQMLYRLRYSFVRVAKLIVVFLVVYWAMTVVAPLLPYWLSLLVRFLALPVLGLLLYGWRFLEKEEVDAFKRQVLTLKRSFSMR